MYRAAFVSDGSDAFGGISHPERGDVNSHAAHIADDNSACANPRAPKLAHNAYAYADAACRSCMCERNVVGKCSEKRHLRKFDFSDQLHFLRSVYTCVS